MKSPKVKSLPTAIKAPKVQVDPGSYKSHYPSWQIGLLDIDGMWGVKSVESMMKFAFSSELIEALNDHEEVFNALDELKKDEFLDLNDFVSELERGIKKDLPLSTMKNILTCISRHVFENEVYPKLKHFEKLTWHEIEAQTYGFHRKTKHHNISISKLKKEAQDRLKELKLDDIDEIFSLRLDGKFRIYGIRKFSYLQIVWFDREHSAYDFAD